MALTKEDLNKIKKVIEDATAAALAEFFDLALKPEIDRLEQRIISLELKLDKLEESVRSLKIEVLDMKHRLNDLKWDAPSLKGYKKLEIRVTNIEKRFAFAKLKV
jgi:predicted  nucleic acid-binding Zn-ribbon protein